MTMTTTTTSLRRSAPASPLPCRETNVPAPADPGGHGLSLTLFFCAACAILGFPGSIPLLTPEMVVLPKLGKVSGETGSEIHSAQVACVLGKNVSVGHPKVEQRHWPRGQLSLLDPREDEGRRLGTRSCVCVWGGGNFSDVWQAIQSDVRTRGTKSTK